MKSNAKQLFEKLIKALGIKNKVEYRTHKRWMGGGQYGSPEAYSSIYLKTSIGEYTIRYSSVNNGGINDVENITIRPPRTNSKLYTGIIKFHIAGLDEESQRIKDILLKDVAKKEKQKKRREENRPIDELTIIAKALEEANIPFKRHGKKLQFDFVFTIKIEMDNKGLYIIFGRGQYSYRWRGQVEGDLTNPDSKLIDNIVKIAQHAFELDKIANEITVGK